ncbi:hypothetical protein TRVA0_002S00716 [Trichomonascus vanleenenianus]|uniref:uncharacterized protein n=1 Tax=Trichomonascus vanleenenianus TaxID=2268995 RepID=UPI003EC9B499
MSNPTVEENNLIAINAIHSIPNLSIRGAGRTYTVPESTIRQRMHGRTYKGDSWNGRKNLTPLEEEAIVKHIIERDAQGFAPRRADVGDMANVLLAKRGGPCVGKNWTDRFIKRRPELSKLKVRLRTPTPPGTADGPPESWVSKTPRTSREAILQSIFIKDMIARHEESSPIPIYSAVDKLAKGMQLIFHDMELMKAEIQDLREQNTSLSKQRRVKRTRLQDGGVIKGSRIRKLMAEKGVVEEEERVEEENEGSSMRRRTGLRLCGICRKTGHNIRICPEAGEICSSSDTSSSN